MRSRGLVVAIAVVLAVLAAVGVIVYTNQVKTQNEKSGVQVLVSSQTIDTGTELNPLIDQGVFKPVYVPEDAAVQSAVTTTEQLRNQTTTAPIYANEQIPVDRLSSAETGNNLLGISDGNVGVGMQVEGPRAVNGYVQVGNHIVIYATFSAGTPVSKVELKQLLTPAQITKFYAAVTGAGGTTGSTPTDIFVMPVDFTTTLVPAVKVLAIQNPPVDSTSGEKQSGPSTMVLDLTPRDAQDVIFANEKAQIWLGLLPPDNEKGYPTGAGFGAPFGRVVGVNGK